MSLKAMAQEKVERAGIANYSFDHDDLLMCGVRYLIEACNCGEIDCDGVRLLRAADAPPQSASPLPLSSSSQIAASTSPL